MSDERLQVVQDMLRSKGAPADFDYKGQLYTDERALIGERITRVQCDNDGTEYIELVCESGLRLRIVASEWISGVRCIDFEGESEKKTP